MNCAIHMSATQRVLRYAKDTIDFSVQFKRSKNFKLEDFSDSDWVGAADDYKSTSTYCFRLKSRAFSWSSRKQDFVTQSRAGAEFVLTVIVNQIIWLRKILFNYM